jgi:hypothetical protein
MDMRAHVRELQQRLAVWAAMRVDMLRSDDRGAVTTETAIITALVGIAAFALATFIATNVTGWQSKIPTP